MSALAALDDPSIDELDDVRLAAQEGFVSLIASVPDGTDLLVTVTRGTDEVALEFAIQGRPRDSELDGLSMSVLRTVASSFSCVDDEGGRRLLVRLPVKGSR